MTHEELTFTRDELVLLAETIHDLAHYGKVEPRNGLTTNKDYLTPYTCYCLSNILKKVTKHLYGETHTYLQEYLKLRVGTNLGQ